MTFSALIRHMGSPTPGAVVAPAYSRFSTRRLVFCPRRKADCHSVCPGPRALPRQAW